MIDYELVNWLLYALKSGIIIAVSVGVLIALMYAVAMIVIMCKANVVKKDVDEHQQAMKERHEKFMTRFQRNCQQPRSDITAPDSP